MSMMLMKELLNVIYEVTVTNFVLTDFLSQDKELKDIEIQIGRDINVPTKTTIISFFAFRAFIFESPILILKMSEGEAH